MFKIFEFLKTEVYSSIASSALLSNHKNGVIFCIVPPSYLVNREKSCKSCLKLSLPPAATRIVLATG